eukprot:675725_1
MAGALNKDGKKYADRSKSSIISYLLDENSNSYRRQLELKGIKPKNHHRENLKHIEQIQRAAKQDQENKMKLANMAKSKSSKYSKVDSKLKDMLTSKPPSASSSNPRNTNFISQNMRNVHSQSSLNATSADKKERINTKRKPAIPKRSELNIKKKGALSVEKDFISLNKKRPQITQKNNTNNETPFMNKKGYGKVPKYIIQRKLQKEEMEHKKMEEEELAKIPRGMRKMEDDERLETLDILEANKHDIIHQIKNLPLVIETPSMIRHQSQLNKSLNEIERTIRVFEKPTVFVALDL